MWQTLLAACVLNLGREAKQLSLAGSGPWLPRVAGMEEESMGVQLYPLDMPLAIQTFSHWQSLKR